MGLSHFFSGAINIAECLPKLSQTAAREFWHWHNYDDATSPLKHLLVLGSMLSIVESILLRAAYKVFWDQAIALLLFWLRLSIQRLGPKAPATLNSLHFFFNES